LRGTNSSFFTVSTGSDCIFYIFGCGVFFLAAYTAISSFSIDFEVASETSLFSSLTVYLLPSYILAELLSEF
jgi:hypothetical protein